MRHRLQNVSIDVDAIPSTSWTLDTRSVAEIELAPLAEALANVVRERYGAVLIYPDLAAGTTRIRVEWQLDRRRRYWWRLGILVTGAPGRPSELSAYVGPGDAHKVGTLTADAKEIDAISREFSAVLEAAATRVRGATGSQRALFYIEFPPPWAVKRDTALPAFRAEVLTSMVVKPNAACVSAVIVTIPDPSRVVARELATSVIAEVTAVLTLVAGRPVTLWQRQPDDFLHPGMAPQKRGAVYPRRFFRADTEEMRGDLAQAATVTAEVISRLSGERRDLVQRMLLAYAAGKEVEQGHPTMAAVAFLAALAAGLKEERCERATCTEHGVTARHPLRGERDVIVDRLLSMGVAIEAEREDLRGLLARAYWEQRSAFVHDAQLAHDERSARLFGLPTPDSVVSPHWRRRNDLGRLDALTRGLVFGELAASAGVRLMGPPVPVSIRESTGFEGVVHARPHTRLQIRNLSRKPIYMVAAPGAELHVGLRDLVAGSKER